MLILNLGGDIRFNGSSEDERMRRAAVTSTISTRGFERSGRRARRRLWPGLFGGSDLWMRYKLDPRDVERRTARVDYVSPEYFDVLGMQVLGGRTFLEMSGPAAGGRR